MHIEVGTTALALNQHSEERLADVLPERVNKNQAKKRRPDNMRCFTQSL